MNNFFIVNLIFITAVQIAAGQTEAPSPAADACNGIFISYAYTFGSPLPPDMKSDPTNQPYRFESTLTVLNNGLEELKSWMVYVGFHNREYLVSASNAVLADGNSIPALVGNGTTFSGYPATDLKTAIETAGDVNQMQALVNMVGTQFGVASPDVPMPNNLTLVNDGFICSPAEKQGTRELQVCCTKDANFKANITTGVDYLPRKNGDLSITYDVIRTYESNYWAQVTIENENPIGRLDNWRLSWDWMRKEFINSMKGAYPSVIDSTDCIFGDQGQYYKGVDFSNVLNCEQRPTIVDLPLEKTNDTTLGLIPFCCRNGTILPKSMDPSKSMSVFQMEVFKMPPDLNRSELFPPQNFKINGALNSDYQCGPPVRVSPSQFPNPNGLASSTSAVASWQVVCNITQAKGSSPKCCVSFSAFYNESVVPCKTCACGCSANTDRTCSTTSPAMLLPSQALLIPFENRTLLARTFADINHLTVPNPLPCSDNCGVSINWHVYTDYTRGWSARITLFNWGEVNFADWFAAVELDKGASGFEAMYSFNGSLVSGINNTIIMQGNPGLNYLTAEVNGSNPDKDYRVPGKQQTVISFTKKNTPGINVPAGDGFPTKVYFNGEECSLPTFFPTSDGYKKGFSLIVSVLLAVVVLFMTNQRL